MGILGLVGGHPLAVHRGRRYGGDLHDWWGWADRSVADDHVAPHPAFDLQLGESTAWPGGCPVCDRAVTRTIALEGTDALGDVGAMVAPVAIQKVAKLDAPCCDEHDGVGLRREDGRTIIAFRSLAYWRRFMAANSLSPTDFDGSVALGLDATRADS